jgi:RNA polymerase sigma factor (sigma-70 family)
MEYRRTQQANRPIAEVVAAAAAGEERAWDELVRRYNRMIAGVAHTWGCNAADVPDVQQAVWARLFENIGRLRQPEAIAGWLAVVTRRECSRLCGNRPQTLQIDETEPLPAGDDEPLVTVLHAERRAAVRRAVATLPARRRTLLETMLDHPDEEYDQLAIRLAMPVGSIGPTRRRSLNDLRGHRELGAWRPTARTA